MKVLFLRSNSVNPDSRVEKEVNCLLSEGYDVEIYCWDRERNYSVQKKKKRIGKTFITVFMVGIKSSYGAGFKKNLIPLLKFQLEIVKFLYKNKNYSFIHACDFDTAFASFFSIKNQKNVKFIYDIFDFYVDSFSVPYLMRSFIRIIDEYIINNADAVIICSEKRIEQIGKVKPKKIYIIHNSPDISILNDMENLSLNKNKMKICYVGILNDGRMLEELLKFAMLNKKFELHIGGFGKYEALFYEASQSFNNVYYYGKLEYNQTLQLEKSCDILTAIYDPKIRNHIFAAPNKFYEALMLGKPLIMVKGTGFSEVVQEFHIGEVINYNYYSLEKGLYKLFTRKKEFNMIKEVEINMYKSKYDWETMRIRLISLYNSLK